MWYLNCNITLTTFQVKILFLSSIDVLSTQKNQRYFLRYDIFLFKYPSFYWYNIQLYRNSPRVCKCLLYLQLTAVWQPVKSYVSQKSHKQLRFTSLGWAVAFANEEVKPTSCQFSESCLNSSREGCAGIIATGWHTCMPKHMHTHMHTNSLTVLK